MSTDNSQVVIQISKNIVNIGKGETHVGDRIYLDIDLDKEALVNKAGQKEKNYENLGRRGISTEQFKGREKDLDQLHKLLQGNCQVQITAAVTGMGGVGKTELAIQYARKYLSLYQGGVGWFQAKNYAFKLLGFARSQFDNISIPEGAELEEQIQACWQQWVAGEVLLVIDDVTDYKTEIESYLPEDSRFKVLLTSRLRFQKPIVSLDLEILEPDAALEVLEFWVGKKKLEPQLEDAKKICEWLGFLPLGLELVGRYVQDEEFSLGAILAELQKMRLTHPALEKEDYSPITAQLGVRDALNLSWQKLDEKAQILSCILGVFTLAEIQWQWVESIYQILLGEGFNTIELTKSRKALMSRSLLKGQKSYTLHQLIWEFLQEKLEELEIKEKIKHIFIEVIEAEVLHKTGKLTVDTINQMSPIIPHLEEIVENRTSYISNPYYKLAFEKIIKLYKLQTFWSKDLEISDKTIADAFPDPFLKIQTILSLSAESILQSSISHCDQQKIPKSPELSFKITDAPSLQLNQQTLPKTSELGKTPNQSPEEPKAGIYPRNEQQTSKSSNLSIRVPDAPSLREPLTLARALKPLMRRVPYGKAFILDKATTVQEIADERVLIPVFKPTVEPWLDLQLVVDEAISMQIWRGKIEELERLLKNFGGFRDVRVWGLITDEKEQVQIRRGIGATAKNQTPRSPKELIDPTGRRLVWVVSDCVSSVWRNGEITPVLELWAKTGSMAILQVLPKWLWKKTALGRASEVRLRGLTPKVFMSNRNLIVEEVLLLDEQDKKTWVKVPVFTLGELGALAQMLSGNGSTSGYVLNLDIRESIAEPQYLQEFIEMLVNIMPNSLSDLKMSDL